jgi:hypothetical protein
MIKGRTSRNRPPAVLSALLAAFCLHASAAPADDPARPQVRYTLHGGSDAPLLPMLVVSGSWPSRCTPQVAATTRGMDGFTIDLRPRAIDCAPAADVRYTVRVEAGDLSAISRQSGAPVPVRVFLSDGASSHLAAFALIDPRASDRAVVPESGFWWSQPGGNRPASPGTGVAIESQDGRIAAGLLTFDGTGRPSWLFGSAALDRRVAGVTLVRLEGGDEAFSAYGNRPIAQAGPRLEIGFVDATTAKAYLVRDLGAGGLEVRDFALARTPFATVPPGSAWSGRWVLVRDDDDAASVLDLGDPATRDAESFTLHDSVAGAVLDCRLAADSAAKRVSSCSLNMPGRGTLLFDDIGIDRLAGRDDGGTMAQLVRLP